jgi:hypothetical protein
MRTVATRLGKTKFGEKRKSAMLSRLLSLASANKGVKLLHDIVKRAGFHLHLFAGSRTLLCLCSGTLRTAFHLRHLGGDEAYPFCLLVAA